MNIQNIEKSIYDFLKQFSQPYIEFAIPSIDSNSNLNFPVITYNCDLQNWRTTGLLQIRIWDKNTNYSDLYTISENIRSKIDEGYKCGEFVLHQGSPFVQKMPQDDMNIKCVYINLEINFY